MLPGLTGDTGAHADEGLGGGRAGKLSTQCTCTLMLLELLAQRVRSEKDQSRSANAMLKSSLLAHMLKALRQRICKTSSTCHRVPTVSTGWMAIIFGRGQNIKPAGLTPG